MSYKNAAGMIALAAFFLAAPASAQIEEAGGSFYEDCWIADGPAITILLDKNLRITTFGKAVNADYAYRTKGETFDGEDQTMQVSLCDDKMENCKDIEAVMTTYKADAEAVEAAIEYFDGSETQGDSESVQGHTISFTASRDKDRPSPKCL